MSEIAWLNERFDAHRPYVETSECDMCGTHQYWSCSCGWSEDDETSRVGNGNGGNFMYHFKEVLREHLG